MVVAVEFDEDLDDIIYFTKDLIGNRNPDVHVVHAFRSHTAVADYAPYLIDAMAKYEEHFKREIEAVRKIVQKMTAAGLNAHGFMKPIDKNIADSIIEFAKGKEADLIIAGSHHPNRVERLVIGSVAGKLVQNSPVPVVVVPRKEK